MLNSEKVFLDKYTNKQNVYYKDEYDIAIAEEAYNEYVNDNKKSRPITELWKELEL